MNAVHLLLGVQLVKAYTGNMGIAERKERQRAELREQILRVARDIVVKEGFPALSMRKLADAVEYAPATLYLHFENREAIAKELCVRGFQDLLAMLEPAAQVEDPLERLPQLAAAYVRFGLEHPETYRLIFMEDPKLSTALFGDHPEGPGPRSFGVLVQVFVDLLATGRLEEGTKPEQLAEVLWAGVHGIVSLRLTCTGFPGTPAEELAQVLVTTLLKGLPGLKVGRAQKKAQ